MSIKEEKKKLRYSRRRLRHFKKAGKRAGKIAAEFREFVTRGNVTDMAMGIIVGSSFTAIARSLADDIITPLLGLLMGGIDLSALAFTVNSPFFENYSVSVSYGMFVQAIVSFFIIAVSVFFMVKALNAVRRLAATPPSKPKPDEQLVLLTQIRDILLEMQGKDCSAPLGDSVPESLPGDFLKKVPRTPKKL